MLGKDGLIMNYKEYTVLKNKTKQNKKIIDLKNDKKTVRKQMW